MNIFASVISTPITLSGFLLCECTALILGLLLSLTYMFRSTYTKSFAVTVALLPSIVTVVIMLVSGNLGAGIAVAGTFSLIRFRSVPGTAREIVTIFLAMAVGLSCGMGYIGFAIVFALILCAVTLIYNLTSFGEDKIGNNLRVLKITIPEDLEYSQMFNDIFDRYTVSYRETEVKTMNLGSLDRLTYEIELKNGVSEKMFLDELRCRNGNLEIVLAERRQQDMIL